MYDINAGAPRIRQDAQSSRLRLISLLVWLMAACAAMAQPPVPLAEPMGHELLPDAFIRHWLIASPLPGTLDSGGLATEGMLAPLPGDLATSGGQTRPFERYACTPNDPAVRFGAATADAVAYAVTYILSDIEWSDVKLLCGADAGLRVWLNGKEVVTSLGSAGPDQVASPPIVLNKGVNRLVLKVVSGGGFWATVRLADAMGSPMPDVFNSQRPDPEEPLRPESQGNAASFGVDEQGLIHNWLVLAPFPSGGSLATPILPDEANARPRPGESFTYGDQTRQWTSHQTPTWIMDFVHFVGGPCDGALGYAVAYIASNDTMENLTMRLSADDVSRVYLNGHEIIVTQSGWFQPDKDQAAGITLNRGLNVLVAKTLNSDHLWQTAVRFVDAATEPVTDVAIFYEPDEPKLREPRTWPGG